MHDTVNGFRQDRKLGVCLRTVRAGEQGRGATYGHLELLVVWMQVLDGGYERHNHKLRPLDAQIAAQARKDIIAERGAREAGHDICHALHAAIVHLLHLQASFLGRLHTHTSKHLQHISASASPACNTALPARQPCWKTNGNAGTESKSLGSSSRTLARFSCALLIASSIAITMVAPSLAPSASTYGHHQRAVRSARPGRRPHRWRARKGLQRALDSIADAQERRDLVRDKCENFAAAAASCRGGLSDEHLRADVHTSRARPAGRAVTGRGGRTRSSAPRRRQRRPAEGQGWQARDDQPRRARGRGRCPAVCPRRRRAAAP